MLVDPTLHDARPSLRRVHLDVDNRGDNGSRRLNSDGENVDTGASSGVARGTGARSSVGGKRLGDDDSSTGVRCDGDDGLVRVYLRSRWSASDLEVLGAVAGALS